MKIKALLLTTLSLLLTGCFSGLSLPNSFNSSISSQTTSLGDQGYLKITRQQKSEIICYDYLFVSNDSFEFRALGKKADGTPADYTYAATWESTNPDSFFVSEGRVGTRADGEGKLRATYGNYSDEIDIKVVTPAKYVVEQDPLDEYRTGKTYDMPFIFEPKNAFAEYTFSKENSVQVLENNQFIPLEAGQIDVTVKSFNSDKGRYTLYNFTMNVVENDAPYFTIKDEKAYSGSLDVAKNKYKALDSDAINDMGIKAFAGDDDTDITSSITVKSGEFDLTTEGEYHVTLSAINKDIETTFSLTLVIIEKEMVWEKVKFSLPIDSYSINVTSLRVATATVRTHIDKEYEDYTGSIGYSATFVVKHNVSGTQETISKYESKYLTHAPNGPYSVTITYESTFDMRIMSNIEPTRQFVEFSGYGYNYIVY